MLKELTINNKTSLTIFGSSENSFMVTSTLIIENQKAFLVGAKFTQEDAQEIVDYLQSNSIILEKILIIHGDPDYYFGLETIKKAFPDALAVATKSTVKHILASLEGKLDVWKESLGEQAPKNVVIPQVLTTDSIVFGETTWELIGSNPKRINLWDGVTKTLVGGIDTFNEIHLFLADTKTVDGQKLWVDRINELITLNPTIVIPSHGDIEKSLSVSALYFTKDYLLKSIDVLYKVTKSEEFQVALTTAYPDTKNTGVLALSSKVVTNEIPWG